ncbi:unnamed protein product, partial [Rotaria magnacalcarata]
TSAPTKMPPVYANDRLIAYALANDPTFVFIHNSSVELHTDHNRLGEAKIDCIPQVSNNGTIARLAAKALILELQHSKLPSSIGQNHSVSNNGTIARLAAKALILELQHSKLPSSIGQNHSGSLQSRFQHNQPSPTPTVDEKEITKKRIIELSLKYQILSPHTAFIGVEKRVNSSNADMVLREVPIQISAGDEHLFEFQQKMDFCAPTIQYCAMPPSALRASMNQSNLS